MGTSEAVAVVTVTDSLNAHREEIASPRKPKVDTVVRSSNEDSLEVWCLRPTKGRDSERIHTGGSQVHSPMES
jgi:hypothetical protein